MAVAIPERKLQMLDSKAKIGESFFVAPQVERPRGVRPGESSGLGPVALPGLMDGPPPLEKDDRTTPAAASKERKRKPYNPSEILQHITLNMDNEFDRKVQTEIDKLIRFVRDDLPVNLIVCAHKLEQFDANEKELKSPEYVAQHSRYEIMTELKTLKVLKRYVSANMQLNQAGTDERILSERLQKMIDVYRSVPPRERHDMSWLEAYNSIFNLGSATVKHLAKDHCPHCKRPLECIKKQALLLCKNCGRLIESLAPLSEGSSAQTYIRAQPPPPVVTPPAIASELKRLKVIRAKLNQFRADAPAVPSFVLLAVTNFLKRTDHLSGSLRAAPTPVGDALKELAITEKKFEDWIQYKDRIANMINKVPVCKLTNAQIEEICSRLKAIHKVYQQLEGKSDRLHVFGNFFVHQICLSMGEADLAVSFSVQRTPHILKAQTRVWKVLLRYLSLHDKQHKWIKK